ncbi:uncharacterized protein LOC132202345 [Neocloeon triangulifer]|uniref:uncharacterized protein LOC132202345 n=1 Tax=Neocloeon triangulifer TaxID=2078957 RepID=UPI00286F6EA3|nr:uncharacterized protein LOC132202345 [Neocloeon triangulifer]
MAKAVMKCAVLLALCVLSATAQELLTATNYRTDDGQQRSESTDGQGNVRGEYSYVDPNGKTITVKYTAGKDGFKVEGDHLPKAPAVPAPAAPAAPEYRRPQQQQWNQQPAQPQAPQQPQQNPQHITDPLWNAHTQPHWAQTLQQQPQYNPPQPQYNPPQPQYNPPQAQYNPPQPQWNQPQPQYNPQQQFASQAPATQQLQNFPGLPQPSNYLQPQAAPQQQPRGQVSVTNTPNAGYSYSYNV